VANNPDGIDGVIFASVENGRITALHAIRNPEKLGAVSTTTPSLSPRGSSPQRTAAAAATTSTRP
jgi:hypothetical protein